MRRGGACLDGDCCNLVSYCGVAPGGFLNPPRPRHNRRGRKWRCGVGHLLAGLGANRGISSSPFVQAAPYETYGENTAFLSVEEVIRNVARASTIAEPSIREFGWFCPTDVKWIHFLVRGFQLYAASLWLEELLLHIIIAPFSPSGSFMTRNVFTIDSTRGDL